MTENDKLELITYRIKKSKDTLHEVEILIKNELWLTAANRIYYACFYAVTALMLKEGLNAKSHVGIRQMFGLHFIKTGLIPVKYGKFYSEIFDMRHTGDYDDYVSFSKDEVEDAFNNANDFVNFIGTILNK